MLVFLPIFTFLAAWLSLAGWSFSRPGASSLRLAGLQTTALLAAFVALSSEFLSLFHALTTAWVALLWAALLFITIGAGWRQGWLLSGWRAWVAAVRCLERQDIYYLSILAVPVALLFLVAAISPVNNTDSLQYHLARVVHWAQNRSLQPYASGYPPQILQPIWAEEAILQLRLLWGNDQLANLVQWGSMIGSLAAVTWIAKLLGARRSGQFAAATFSISIPMGLLQATSTQNDYVAAFWLASLACWAVLAARRKLSPGEWTVLGFTLGLGLLTKGTLYPYAAPFVLWILIGQAKQIGFTSLFQRSLLIVGLVAILNLGFWVRNTQVFGDPLAISAWTGDLTAGGAGPGPLITSLPKNIIMNFATPYPGVNERLAGGLRAGFGNWDASLADFHLTWGWNQEDLAGNPLHLFLVPVALVLMFIFRKRFLGRLVWAYAGVCLASFVLLSLGLRYQVYGLRFQLPFLVAWAPVFGVVISLVEKPRFASFVVILLVISTLPWIFFNRSRPLISMRNPPDRFGLPCDWHFGCTVGSILVEPPQTIAFANWMDLRQPYLAASEAVGASGCRQVGLRIDSHDPEYLLWWSLGAPQNGIRVENIYPLPDLARYADPAFNPCAVICTICKDRKEVENLPLFKIFGDLTLFLKK